MINLSVMEKKRTMDKVEMLNLRLNGYSYAYIGEKAGISRQRVQILLSPPKGIKDYILKKFNGKCQRCGIYVGWQGHIHHKGNGNEENYNDLDNLELLCKSCHRRSHYFHLDFPEFKLERNTELRKYAKDNPDLSYREIGEVFGISRQRAWIIINKEENK